jgi:hypothetical protein
MKVNSIEYQLYAVYMKGNLVRSAAILSIFTIKEWFLIYPVSAIIVNNISGTGKLLLCIVLCVR